MPALAVKFLITSALSAGGAAGGWFIYKGTSPVTINDKFRKDGLADLTKDHEYKAVIHDQRENLKKVDALKEIKDDSGYEILKSWCEGQRKILISDNTADPQFPNLCTTGGIISVKGYITQQTEGVQWIKENEDKSYQITLAIYKYNGEFLEWINGGLTKPVVSEKSKPKNTFSALKNKCSAGLAMGYRSIPDEIKYYKWWCQKPPYTTVGEKLKAKAEDWEKKDDWKGMGDTWNKTDEVRKAVQKPNSHNHPKDDEYQQWCNDKLNANLGDDGVYQTTYLLVKRVCGKETA